MKKNKDQSQKTTFAKKSFGQNFLVDNSYVEKIIQELNPQPDEKIIEIGPGRGALTGRLIKSGANITAIELDKDLVPLLVQEFNSFENFSLIEGDALKLEFSKLVKDSNQSDKAKLVANLPYYISTAILQKLIENREVFIELILMLQREVVERITAKPGKTERGYLTVLLEAFAETEKLFDVPPKAFRPVPKVWSSVVRVKFNQDSSTFYSIVKEKTFWKLVSCGFAQKRKTILNNLKNAPKELKYYFKSSALNDVLENIEVEQSRRAETLSIEEWVKLGKALLNY
jgi:16S rRNA (adenine1518-N6/adenine1519-N6)-dimethyltransferase